MSLTRTRRHLCAPSMSTPSWPAATHPPLFVAHSPQSSTLPGSHFILNCERTICLCHVYFIRLPVLLTFFKTFITVRKGYFKLIKTGFTTLNNKCFDALFLIGF